MLSDETIGNLNVAMLACRRGGRTFSFYRTRIVADPQTQIKQGSASASESN